MTAYPPTAEQQNAIDLFATGKTLVIEAGAGTGKTSTLQFLGRSTERRGQYVAFNTAIVAEARTKFPGTVACSTAHSLAVRSIRTPGFEKRQQQGKRMRTIDIANRLGVDPVAVTTHDGERKMLSSTFLAGQVFAAVKNFCKTADDAPTWKHVPTIPGLDAPKIPGQRGSGRVRGDVNRYVAKAIEPAVRRAWADLTNEEGGLPFTKSTAFSVYLKLWQLSHPIIPASYLLFDEAQDASPVMVDVVARQADPEFRASRGLKPAQIVWVGDSQQQINRFTGAINALQTMPHDARAFLTQSFRFGPAIADVANQILGLIPDAEIRLSGFDEIASVVEPIDDPDCILTRTNATAVRSVLEAQRDGKTVHLVGGGKDVVEFAKAARDLMDGLKVDHPELACFDDWAEVQEYVDQDEQGGDLRLLVKLIDEFGVEPIVEALERMPSEKQADLIVSTAHKSKGREWDTVELADDFPEKIEGEELRLLYVAVTRARLRLDASAVPFLPAPPRLEDEAAEERHETAPRRTVAEAFGPEIADRLARLAIDIACAAPSRDDSTHAARIPWSLIRETRAALEDADVDWKALTKAEEARRREAAGRYHAARAGGTR